MDVIESVENVRDALRESYRWARPYAYKLHNSETVDSATLANTADVITDGLHNSETAESPTLDTEPADATTSVPLQHSVDSIMQSDTRSEMRLGGEPTSLDPEPPGPDPEHVASCPEAAVVGLEPSGESSASHEAQNLTDPEPNMDVELNGNSRGAGSVLNTGSADEPEPSGEPEAVQPEVDIAAPVQSQTAPVASGSVRSVVQSDETPADRGKEVNTDQSEPMATEGGSNMAPGPATASNLKAEDVLILESDPALEQETETEPQPELEPETETGMKPDPPQSRPEGPHVSTLELDFEPVAETQPEPETDTEFDTRPATVTASIQEPGPADARVSTSEPESVLHCGSSSTLQHGPDSDPGLSPGPGSLPDAAPHGQSSEPAPTGSGNCTAVTTNTSRISASTPVVGPGPTRCYRPLPPISPASRAVSVTEASAFSPQTRGPSRDPSDFHSNPVSSGDLSGLSSNPALLGAPDSNSTISMDTSDASLEGVAGADLTTRGLWSAACLSRVTCIEFTGSGQAATWLGIAKILLGLLTIVVGVSTHWVERVVTGTTRSTLLFSSG